ncbi:MAG: 50S ribosomal protein L13 [Phycisphaerales bacterium]|nr:50S ribosomal protein L13 [Phycisphaerales bacterium]
MRQTTFIKTGQLEPKWYHVDADGQRLGRVSVQIATVLMGKHRPEYTPHVDTGDFVVVTNAEKLVMTGRKGDQKLKLRYSGYPGGLKAKTYNQVLEHKPEQLLEDAVRRMLPKGRLGRKMLGKLKVYRGTEHPHTAQQPEPMPRVR